MPIMIRYVRVNGVATRFSIYNVDTDERKEIHRDHEGWFIDEVIKYQKQHASEDNEKTEQELLQELYDMVRPFHSRPLPQYNIDPTKHLTTYH